MFAETDRQVDSGGDRQVGRRAGRQTAITQHKYLRGQCYQRNERLFRSISSSSSILVARAPSLSFIARFLIDDKAIYVSLMFPSSSSHRSRSLPLIRLAVYAPRVLFFLSCHPHQLLFFFLNSAHSARCPRLSLPCLHSRLGCFFFFFPNPTLTSSSSLCLLPPLHPLFPLTSFSLQALSPSPAVHLLFYLFHYLNSACHFSHFSSPSSLYTCSCLLYLSCFSSILPFFFFLLFLTFLPFHFLNIPSIHHPFPSSSRLASVLPPCVQFVLVYGLPSIALSSFNPLLLLTFPHLSPLPLFTPSIVLCLSFSPSTPLYSFSVLHGLQTLSFHVPLFYSSYFLLSFSGHSLIYTPLASSYISFSILTPSSFPDHLFIYFYSK